MLGESFLDEGGLHRYPHATQSPRTTAGDGYIKLRTS